MKKWCKIGLLSLLAITALVLAGCSQGGRGAGSDQPAVISRATAQMGKLPGGAVVSGRLEALYSADVVPRTPGKVAEITVDVGDAVKEGDLLVSLDVADLEALVDLYAAQLDKARNSDLPAQKIQAELALAKAEAGFLLAEADYLRSKQLKDASALSQQQFEEYDKVYLQEKAAYEAAKKSLDILVNATIPETIRQCEAQLQKARADYNNSIIRAPLSGVVTARNINPGEMANAAQTVISIVNLDTVAIQAGVSEDQVNKIHVGQEVQVRVGSVRDEPFTGRVSNIALAANASTRAYPVKIQIENPGHLLKPGMYAEVLLEAGPEAGIVIPAAAVFKLDQKSYVWVIEDGCAHRREVETGQSGGGNVIVRAGLKEGEELAVTGIEALREGMKVVIQN
ncbi:MAG TPA: efflux RND transporter periplasmic adaptor subunit [Bacillota bacterium]|nr:efflux RND transporter periplasmic adaptor subunit [Peptococcaceae bacterium]HPZ43172.1 efflux RND transporter periplasmic adaptor subunit [Bacillota bacterium]HQD75727.1 efflux RND transporter periplasmic adaptor subunit [Bacillota bacterium]HUM58584.1 efflux RND transporter periplasmic adaptor subunit [Bacillota bacterium]